MPDHFIPQQKGSVKDLHIWDNVKNPLFSSFVINTITYFSICTCCSFKNDRYTAVNDNGNSKYDILLSSSSIFI